VGSSPCGQQRRGLLIAVGVRGVGPLAFAAHLLAFNRLCSPDSWSSPTTLPPTWALTPNLPPWRLMAYPPTYPAIRCSPLDTDTQMALGRLEPPPPPPTTRRHWHCVSTWGSTATLPLSSSVKRQRKGGLPCKGTSCLRRSFDESKRCTQHPELANQPPPG
jgi:hypothetical protein